MPNRREGIADMYDGASSYGHHLIRCTTRRIWPRGSTCLFGEREYILCIKYGRVFQADPSLRLSGEVDIGVLDNWADLDCKF